MRNNRGFTLIECLISLVILMSILMFLQPFLRTVKTIGEQAKKSAYLEVQTGKIQMDMEIKMAEFKEIKKNQLIYSHPDEGDIVFEQYNQMIRKTSEKNGHQPIMTEIETVEFTEQEGLIQMEVHTLEKETYIYFFFF